MPQFELPSTFWSGIQAELSALPRLRLVAELSALPTLGLWFTSAHGRHLRQLILHALLQLGRANDPCLGTPTQHPSGDLLQPGEVRLKLDNAPIWFDLPYGLSWMPHDQTHRCLQKGYYRMRKDRQNVMITFYQTCLHKWRATIDTLRTLLHEICPRIHSLQQHPTRSGPQHAHAGGIT